MKFYKVERKDEIKIKVKWTDYTKQKSLLCETTCKITDCPFYIPVKAMAKL